MHEHTPSEEAPEPAEDSEPTDPTGAILLHVFLVGLVLVPTGALAHAFSRPAYGATLDLNPLGVIVMWLGFAVYVVSSTVGTILSWRRIGFVIGIHVGALVLALPGGLALLFLWSWLQSLFHG